MLNSKIKSQAIELINEYVFCAKYVCGLLKEVVGDSVNLAGAYRCVGIPKEGYLDGNIYYNFHGVGCYFEMQNTHIDIDFGPDNRCDGFDFFRLKDFKLSRSEKYSELTDDNLKNALNELVKDNLIYNPQWHPSTHLYYLL